MKKIDILNGEKLKPKKQTIAFLLNFSKSMDVLKSGKKRFLISSN